MESAGARHVDPALTIADGDPKRSIEKAHVVEPPPVYDGSATAQADYHDHDDLPTAEELHTLRRVPDKIPPKAYTIAFVELCERLSYYGTTQVKRVRFYVSETY